MPHNRKIGKSSWVTVWKTNESFANSFLTWQCWWRRLFDGTAKTDTGTGCNVRSLMPTTTRTRSGREWSELRSHLIKLESESSFSQAINTREHYNEDWIPLSPFCSCGPREMLCLSRSYLARSLDMHQQRGEHRLRRACQKEFERQSQQLRCLEYIWRNNWIVQARRVQRLQILLLI